jgi:hypothetical protein
VIGKLWMAGSAISDIKERGMETRTLVSGRRRFPVCVLLPLLVWPAVAADRMVLTEEFSWNSCIYCPYANRALNNLLNDPNNQVADGTFTLVQYHIWDSYETVWGYSRAASFYNIPGTPTAWFDGTLPCEGVPDLYNDQIMYNLYLSEYNACRAAPTDVTISVTGVQQVGQTFTIRARVCVEAGGTPKTVRLYMAQVLDHWPTTFAYLRNGFKQAASTEDVVLTDGACELVTRSFTFDATSWANQSNIKLIVWAQKPQANSTEANPASTYQAAVLSWPFSPDCNTNGVPDAADLASGASHDCNANGIPDECDLAATTSQDCNTNGFPDECDIASATSQDCNNNDIPDECDLAAATSQDCNSNSIPDECDLAAATSQDCNANSVPDECDIALESSPDANANGIPDECETVRGDLNCDGSVGFLDINPFVLALTDPAAWHLAYPTCLLANGDTNADGSIGFGDINPFVTLLTGP